MRLPKGCDILTGKVVLLNKAVYGLKQAERQWNLKLVKTFTDEMGLDQSKSDPCLFKMMRGDRVVLITAVHVDDMIVAAETEYLCDCFYAELRRMFPSTDLGNLSWYLGRAFERNLDKGTLRMSQSAFIDSMVSCFEIETESELPAFTTGDLGPKRDDEADCDMPVMAAVGCLLWVAGNTRPNVANPIRAIALHSHNPSLRHWKGLRKIMGYLKGTRDLGVVFGGEVA